MMGSDNVFQNIERDTLIITNNSYKEKILLEMSLDKRIYPLSFMTVKEFINNYFFSYGEKAIYYLMKKYGYKYDVCKVYLDNMIFLDNYNGDSDKLNFLLKLKSELIDNELLEFNPLFSKYLEGKDLIVYNVFPEKMVAQVLAGLNAKIINDVPNNKMQKVYSFENIKDEVRYLFYSISKLFEEGVSYKNIKILNLPEEYYCEVERVSYLYSVPISLDNSSYLETEMVQSFIKSFEKSSIEDSLDKISKQYDVDEEDNLIIYNKILNVCNKLLFVDDKKIFIDMFKAMINKNIKSNRGIQLINIGDYVSDDDYVFLLGFEQGNIPKIYKDENYITDAMKKEIPLYTTQERNVMEFEKTKSFLLGISNLVITYKKDGNNGVCYPSNLLDDDCFFEEDICVDCDKSYSLLEAKLLLGDRLDKLRKFGEKDDDLSLLYNSVDIDYNTYDNSYKNISPEHFTSNLKMPITLSYTSMNDFYMCSFRYYLNYILRLNKYEDTLQIFIGNLFHYILSICFEENFNFDYEFEKYLDNRCMSCKDEFFVNNLKPELKFVIDTIKDHNLLSELKSYLYEESISVPISERIVFNGKIDKIMYKEDGGKTYVAVIDYKTGKTDISLKYKEYGIGLQLPSYLYLIKKSNRFSNVLFSGFFLQKILNKEIDIQKGKSYKKIKRDNLRLIGYSNSDEEILSKLDRSYSDSDMIKGMKLTASGFYHYSNIMSNDEINDLISFVEEKINFASKMIANADFKINPKVIDKENIGCKNCKYSDICYKKEEDKVYINTKDS